MIWLRRCRDTGHYLRKMLICIDLLGMRQPTILSCLVGATVKHAIFVQQDLGLSENPKSNGSSVPPSNFFFGVYLYETYAKIHCSFVQSSVFLVNTTLFAMFDGKIPRFLSHTKRYDVQETQETLVTTPKVKNRQKV